jgi:glycosyltransferase involved in cell wall biosynthesis
MLRKRAPWFFRLPVLPGLLTTLLRRYRLAAFRRFLDHARSRGLGLVWTLHNLERHEGTDSIDEAGRLLLYQYCDLLICHSHWAKAQCLEVHRPRVEPLVMMQGNYDGVYPAPRDPALVRRELGLRTDVPVVSCIGGLRDYKGLGVACEAVARLGGAVQLLLVGSPHPRFDLAALRRQAGSVPGTVLVARRITDAEFADFVTASDCLLLPYRKITTSALLLSAATLARGVVASDLPYMREILGPAPEAGILVRPGDPDDLARGIQSYLSIPAEVRARAARAVAESFRWDRTIVPVAKAFLELGPRRDADAGPTPPVRDGSPPCDVRSRLTNGPADPTRSLPERSPR